MKGDKNGTQLNCSESDSEKIRTYLPEWEEDYSWVKKDDKTCRPICTVCNQILTNKRNHLERHSNTEKHKQNYRNAANSKTYDADINHSHDSSNILNVLCKDLLESDIDSPPPSPMTIERIDQNTYQSHCSTTSDLDVAENSRSENFNKKKHKRRYKPEWERSYRWLKKDDKSGRPMCIVCKQVLANQKNHLERHANTKKHKERFRIACESDESLRAELTRTECNDPLDSPSNSPCPSPDEYSVNQPFKEEPNFSYVSANKKRKLNLDEICERFETVIEERLKPKTNEDNNDELFMKTILGMMKNLPIDVKDDLKEHIFVKVMEKKRECRVFNSTLSNATVSIQSESEANFDNNL